MIKKFLFLINKSESANARYRNWVNLYYVGISSLEMIDHIISS